MINGDKIYLAALNHFSKFGQKRLKLLKNYFPSYKEAFFAHHKELCKSGISDSLASEFIAFRQDLDPEKLSDELNREQISILSLNDEAYPSLLSEIYDPPALLYYRGNIDILKKSCIAVVGSRKNSPYGQKACYKLCSDLICQGFTIVSGLALGIDSIAHDTCIEKNSPTVAVLGSGINKNSIYPSSNRYLSEQIVAEEGLLLSEFTIGTSPMRHNFPMRNRIISGLCLGTIVIEAAIKSGALITAKSALEQNREVFAVPGSIFSELSNGPNALLKQGATPALDAEDILDALDLKALNSYIKKDKYEAETDEEERLLACLSHEPTHIDELFRSSGIDTALGSSTLTIMEMKGVIKNFGGGRYALI